MYSMAGIVTAASLATAGIIGGSYYYYNNSYSDSANTHTCTQTRNRDVVPKNSSLKGISPAINTRNINQMEDSFIKLIENISVFRFKDPHLFDEVVKLTDVFCLYYLKIHMHPENEAYVLAINRVHVELKNALFQLERYFEVNYKSYTKNWMERLKDLTDALEGFRVNATRNYKDVGILSPNAVMSLT